MTIITVKTQNGFAADLGVFFETAGHASGLFRARSGDILAFFGDRSTYLGASYLETIDGRLVETAQFTDLRIPLFSMDRVTTDRGLYRLLGDIEFRGGDGNDYFVSGEGNDTLIGGAGNDQLISNAYANSDDDHLYGGDGNDFLETSIGSDVLRGGTGSDTLVLRTRFSGDYKIDLSSTEWQLVASDLFDELRVMLTSIENVEGSAREDDITGNAVANILQGNAGNDVLDGGRGDDVLDGGGGFDTADFSAFGATTVSLTLGVAYGPAGDDELVSIEGLIGGAGNDDFSGDNAANRFDGGVGNDELDGGAGNDTIMGGDGQDRLIGGAGADLLVGGAGNDVLQGDQGPDILIGGTGADIFTFMRPVSADGETISDFRRQEGDRVDLRPIDANGNSPGDQRFVFIGDAEFTGVAGQLRYEAISGTGQAPVLVQGDVTGDGRADFQITLLTGIALERGDFLL